MVLRSRSGQAMTEYMILLAVIVAGFVLLSRGIAKARLTERLLEPIHKEFAAAYRYGHPEAKGYEDGGPRNHPRANTGSDNNFRIFITPEATR
ncbi:MAG: hypothetical protein NDJ90_04050 [Oligoflexia bacterium]|nr:hypothetical protein [Oligoflexia bacterium]